MPLIDQRTSFTIGESTPYTVSVFFLVGADTSDRYIFTPYQPHDLRDVSVRLEGVATAAATLDILRVPDTQGISSGVSLLSTPISIGAGQDANTIIRGVLAAETTVQQTSSVAIVFTGDRTGLAGLLVCLTFVVVEG